MRGIFLCSAILAGVCACRAQNASPVLLSARNTNPFPLPIAPGQLITLFVQPASAISPVTASAISAVYSADGSSEPIPVLQVGQTTTACNAPLSESLCPQVLAVTIQVPFDIRVLCALCESPVLPGGDIVVTVNGMNTPSVGVQGLSDQVHFVTSCDVIIAGANSPLLLNGGLPCTPMVTHADGALVSNVLPAMAGEELVAYATGLGATSPALTTGQPAAQSSSTVTAFGIDFNYRVNALATRPGPIGTRAASPAFTGATEDYIGLYQINFIVPTPPSGLEPCVETATIAVGGNAVQSNLTVSIGSSFSFDGAGICVRPEPVLDPPAAR